MSGEIIDQDGQKQVYKAHFWRHYSEEWEEFDSPEEAIAFLNYGEEYGTLSATGVVWPDGTERPYDWVHDADGAILLGREKGEGGESRG
jgi:hypothetical protein